MSPITWGTALLPGDGGVDEDEAERARELERIQAKLGRLEAKRRGAIPPPAPGLVDVREDKLRKLADEQAKRAIHPSELALKGMEGLRWLTSQAESRPWLATAQAGEALGYNEPQPERLPGARIGPVYPSEQAREELLLRETDEAARKKSVLEATKGLSPWSAGQQFQIAEAYREHATPGEEFLTGSLMPGLGFVPGSVVTKPLGLAARGLVKAAPVVARGVERGLEAVKPLAREFATSEVGMARIPGKKPTRPAISTEAELPEFRTAIDPERNTITATFKPRTDVTVEIRTRSRLGKGFNEPEFAPTDFDIIKESQLARETIAEVDGALETGEMRRAIKQAFDVEIKAKPTTKAHVGIILTDEPKDVGMGTAGTQSAKVFWAPYSNREIYARGNARAYDLGVDPISTLAHEYHHALGGGGELDIFSDAIAARIHLRHNMELINPELLQRWIWGNISTINRAPKSRHALQAREAMGFAREGNPELFDKLMNESGFASTQIDKVRAEIGITTRKWAQLERQPPKPLPGQAAKAEAAKAGEGKLVSLFPEGKDILTHQQAYRAAKEKGIVKNAAEYKALVKSEHDARLIDGGAGTSSKDARNRALGIPEMSGYIQRPSAAKAVEAAKQPWEMTLKEIGDLRAKQIYGQVDMRSHMAYRRASVEQALSEGKPVPAEVLADYPDLAKQAAKVEAPKVTPKAVKPTAAAETTEQIESLVKRGLSVPITGEMREVTEAWKKALKRLRRAQRQEPRDLDDAMDMVREAEVDFHKTAESLKLSEGQYQFLKNYAQELQTDVETGAVKNLNVRWVNKAGEAPKPPPDLAKQAGKGKAPGKTLPSQNEIQKRINDYVGDQRRLGMEEDAIYDTPHFRFLNQALTDVERRDRWLIAISELKRGQPISDSGVAQAYARAGGTIEAAERAMASFQKTAENNLAAFERMVGQTPPVGKAGKAPKPTAAGAPPKPPVEPPTTREPLPTFTKDLTTAIIKQGRQADLAIRLGWLDEEGRLTKLGELIITEDPSNMSPNIRELAAALKEAVERAGVPAPAPPKAGPGVPSRPGPTPGAGGIPPRGPGAAPPPPAGPPAGAAPPPPSPGGPPPPPPPPAGAGGIPPGGPAPGRPGAPPTPPPPPITPTTPPPPVRTELDRILAQAEEQVRQAQPGKLSSAAQKILGLKQVREWVRPALGMKGQTRPVHVAMVGETAARADVGTRFAPSRSQHIQEFTSAFGGDALKGGNSTIPFIGTAAQRAHPATGKLLDIVTNPQLYDLNNEQRAALANLQGRNTAVRRWVVDGYGAEINDYPVRPGGAFLSTVPEKTNISTYLEMERRNVAAGRAQLRSYETVRDRLTAEPGFKPEWNISNILEGMDTFKSGAAGGETFRAAIGGLTAEQAKAAGHINDYIRVGMGINRYFPPEVAHAINRSRQITNGPLGPAIEVVYDIRSGIFSGDFSPFTIQGQLRGLADPVGAAQDTVQTIREATSGKGITYPFTVQALMDKVAADPDTWARWASMNGHVLGRTPREFSVGFLGKIPGARKANEGAYSWVATQSFDTWKAQKEALIKAGIPELEAEVAANAIVNNVIPLANPALLGQSLAKSKLLQALPTSYSFITKPAELMTKAAFGYAKLITKQPLTSQERLAVKLMTTLAATILGISATSAAISAQVKGRDVGQAVLDAINPDPRNGNFASLVIGDYRFPLAGPFRGYFRAVYPKNLDGVPFGVPFVGLVDWAENRVTPFLKRQLELYANKDFYGRAIVKGQTYVERVLRGLEYEVEGVLPLGAQAPIAAARRGEPASEIAIESVSQIAGANVSRIRPISELRRHERWDEQFEEFEAIPSDPVAFAKAEKKQPGLKTREEYRETNPTVDAKLFIVGKVSDVSTPRAAALVRIYMKIHKIKPDDVESLKKRKQKLEDAREAGIRLRPKLIDLLIPGALSQQMASPEVETPSPAQVPTIETPQAWNVPVGVR